MPSSAEDESSEWGCSLALASVTGGGGEWSVRGRSLATLVFLSDYGVRRCHEGRSGEEKVKWKTFGRHGAAPTLMGRSGQGRREGAFRAFLSLGPDFWTKVWKGVGVPASPGPPKSLYYFRTLC